MKMTIENWSNRSRPGSLDWPGLAGLAWQPGLAKMTIERENWSNRSSDSDADTESSIQ